MNRTRLERPFFRILTDSPLIVVRNHDPFGELLDRIRWPPSNRDGVKAVLIQDIPDRFRFARQVRDRADSASHRVGLAKSMAPMFVSAFSGRNRSPEHR